MTSLRCGPGWHTAGMGLLVRRAQSHPTRLVSKSVPLGSQESHRTLEVKKNLEAFQLTFQMGSWVHPGGEATESESHL